MLNSLRPLVALAAFLPLSLSICLGGCASNKTEIDKEQQLDLYATTAQYLYEDGKLVRAQDQAVKALAIDPDNIPMRRMIGWIRLRLGKNQDLIIAEQFFRELVRDGDDGNAALLGLATAHERLGLAYDENSRAEGISEDERERRQAEARKRWQESRELYERTLSKGEGDTRAMNGLQRVTALLGDLPASLAWSERLLQRAEQNLAAWRRMLENQDLSTTDEDVIRSSETEAITLAVNTHLFAASLLNQLGRPKDAIAHLDAVLAHEPDMAQVYSRRAQLRADLGEKAAAIRDIERYIRLSPHDLDHPDIQAAFELRRGLGG
ncbi:MAG: tetratricopeptide repeat protein [Planctomycetota bacterium]